jgi:hypothetical protein
MRRDGVNMKNVVDSYHCGNNKPFLLDKLASLLSAIFPSMQQLNKEN